MQFSKKQKAFLKFFLQFSNVDKILTALLRYLLITVKTIKFDKVSPNDR